MKEQDKDRKSTRLNSSHLVISYAVFCLKKKGINLHSLGFGNELLNMMAKAQATKGKRNSTLSKLKSFVFQRTRHNRDSLNHQRADSRSKKNYNPAACGTKTTFTER